MFSAKGIDEASINEITAAAGLANGTFYNHFKDKDELAFATAEAIALEIARRLDARMDDLPRGISRVVVASWAFLKLALSYEAWARVLVEQYQRNRIFDSFAAFDYMRADIERAVAQGELEVDVDDFLLEQISALMVAALRASLRQAAGTVPAGEQADLLQRTCEYELRLLGLTPLQAKREVGRVATHGLLSTPLPILHEGGL